MPKPNIERVRMELKNEQEALDLLIDCKDSKKLF